MEHSRHALPAPGWKGWPHIRRRFSDYSSSMLIWTHSNEGLHRIRYHGDPCVHWRFTRWLQGFCLGWRSRDAKQLNHTKDGSMINDQRPMANDQWSLAIDHWPLSMNIYNAWLSWLIVFGGRLPLFLLEDSRGFCAWGVERMSDDTILRDHAKGNIFYKNSIHCTSKK